MFAAIPLSTVQAQLVFEDWISTRGHQDMYVTGKSVTDPQRNLYQAGATLNENGQYDAIVTKYNDRGDELWTQIIDGADSGDDLFIDVAYNSGGKLVATGVSRNSSETSAEILTVQFDALNGQQLWIENYSYPNTIFNTATAISLDANGNIYLSGITYNLSTFSDALVLKYSSGGNLQWVKTEDYSNGGEDGAVKIELKGNSVNVVGGTQMGTNSWRIVSSQYNAVTGTLLNSYASSSYITGLNQIADMAVDDIGNIYIAGSETTSSEGDNIYAMKLDDELNLIWDHSYNFSNTSNGDDRAYGLCLDNANNLIVVGYSDVSSGNQQFTTIKYTNSGTPSWVKSYDVSTAGDTAKAVAADANGNIYVTGTFSNGSNQDLKTIKYNANGDLQWEIDFNGQFNGADNIRDILVNNGEAYITTQSEVETGYRYFTVKYSEIDYDSPQYVGQATTFSNAFIKNSGQLRDENSNTVSSVKYQS